MERALSLTRNEPTLDSEEVLQARAKGVQVVAVDLITGKTAPELQCVSPEQEAGPHERVGAIIAAGCQSRAGCAAFHVQIPVKHPDPGEQSDLVV